MRIFGIPRTVLDECLRNVLALQSMCHSLGASRASAEEMGDLRYARPEENGGRDCQAVGPCGGGEDSNGQYDGNMTRRR